MKKLWDWFTKPRCSHIWKQTGTELLKTTSHSESYGFGIDFYYINHIAVYEKCIKCGKELVREETKRVW